MPLIWGLLTYGCICHIGDGFNIESGGPVYRFLGLGLRCRGEQVSEARRHLVFAALMPAMQKQSVDVPVGVVVVSVTSFCQLSCCCHSPPRQGTFFQGYKPPEVCPPFRFTYALGSWTLLPMRVLLLVWCPCDMVLLTLCDEAQAAGSPLLRSNLTV